MLSYSFLALLLTVLRLLPCSTAQLEGDKFAGNLQPEGTPQSTAPSGDDSDKVLTPGSPAGNLSEHDNIVRVVHPSEGAPGNFSGSTEEQDKTSSQAARKKKPGKAPRPMAKPESVGFTPPPEEEGKVLEEEEKVEQVPAKPGVVHSIPTLPPSIIKPGRMSNGTWYIILYAPWCTYSRAALVEFLQMFQYVVDHNMTQLVIGKIDVIKHGEVAKHFRLKNLPTVLFFKNGVKFTFDYQELTSANLVNFMLSVLNVTGVHNVTGVYSSATVSQVNTSTHLAELKRSHPVIFLIVHDEEIDKDWQSIFMKQAKDKALKAKFAYTTYPDIVKEHDLATLPSIMVLKDDAVFVFKDTLSAYALSKWILLEKDIAFPTVNSTNLRNSLRPVSGRRLAFLVVSEGPKQQKDVIELIRRLALTRKFHSTYQFGLVEGVEIPEILFRRSVGDTPFFFVYEPYTGHYYLFQPGKERGKISEQTITKFLQGVSDGKEERLGGITFFDQVYHAYQLGYGIVQSMMFHRPYLSVITGLCMLGVVIFYTMVCCHRRPTKLSPELRARKAARAKKKREEMARKEAEAAQRRIEAKERAVAKKRGSKKLEKRGEQVSEQKEQTAGDGSEGDDVQSGSELDSGGETQSGSEERDSPAGR